MFGKLVSLILLSIGIILTIFYFVQTFIITHYKVEITFGLIGILLLIGLLSAIGNVTLFQAAANAPNAGLAIAIGGGLQSGVIALLAFLFLKDKLSMLQIIGLLLSIVAVFLMDMGGNKSNTTLYI